MTNQPKPPLWQIMNIASGALLDATFGEATALQCYAAELRSLADWLVPDEPQIPHGARDRSEEGEQEYGAWEERKRLRRILLTEADRAEAGK